MANTTSIMIICFGYEESAIKSISESTGLKFPQVSDDELWGGTHFGSLRAYACCYRSIGLEKTVGLLETFSKAHFEMSELTSITIDDDDGLISGVFTKDTIGDEIVRLKAVSNLKDELRPWQ